MSEDRAAWRDVIWRAWRYTEDRELAHHLFEIVADGPASGLIGWLAVLLGIILGGSVALLGQVVLDQSWWGYGRVLWTAGAIWGLFWAVLIGAGVALLFWGLGGRRLSWRFWLRRITPRVVSLDVVALFAFFSLAGAIVICGGPTSFGRNPLESGGLLRLLIGVGGSFGAVAGLLFGIVGGWVWGIPVTVIVITVGRFGYGMIPWILFGGSWLIAVGLSSVVGGEWRVHARFRWQIWRHLFFWWRGRPYPWELESALRQAYEEMPEIRRVWDGVLGRVEARRRDPGSPEGLIAKLRQDRNWAERMAARHALVAIGGNAVDALSLLVGRKGDALRRSARQLLEFIAVDTAARLALRWHVLYCPRCLTRPSAWSIPLPGLDLQYYGCRSCGQSREFVEQPAGVVAVLDSEMETEREVAAEALWVNWLRYGALFDFDRVEVRRATDEQVERFALQVGNDTDPARQRQYGRMRCTVWGDCGLSENTVRILASLFGRVESVKRDE